MGEYFGSDPEKHPEIREILDAYTASFDFKGLSIDQAMRVYLECFKLPGEAAQIDRIMECLSRQLYIYIYSIFIINSLFRFIQSRGPFKRQEDLFVLCFACIMLNTDLHNPMVKDKMTLKSFKDNLKGQNDGEDLPADYIEKIYNSFKDHELHLQPTMSELQTAVEWDRVLARSKQVAKPNFTTTTTGARFTTKAGIHERDMFLLINDKALNAITV